MKLTLSQFRSRQSAFTMVEIALCLAIVGFALVAIIGVLPAGLNVQKENREDTLLNQDSTVWFDAIRSGSQGYDELTNYVERVRVERYYYESTNDTAPDRLADIVGQQLNTPFTTVLITNGARIVGLLSTPRILRDPSGTGFTSNYVAAYVRAVSGTAAEKAPQDNPDVRDLAFSYRMVVEVVPAGSFDFEGIQTNKVDQTLRQNLADVRLLFRWPLKKPFSATDANDPGVGSGRMSFRTQLGGNLGAFSDSAVAGVPFYFIQPRTYK